jgi:lipopolysaccharide export system protein LptA
MRMRNLSIAVCLAILALALGQPMDVSGQARPTPRVEPAQPIQIVADRLDAYQEKRMAVFTGNCVATQGDRTIRADRLTLTYKDERKITGRAVPEVEAGGNLEKVEAAGHVRITEGDRVVTGEAALFEQDAQKITVTGSAVLREGAHIIHGERIVVFLNENRGVVEGTETKRVSATIYPAEKQGEKP